MIEYLENETIHITKNKKNPVANVFVGLTNDVNNTTNPSPNTIPTKVKIDLMFSPKFLPKLNTDITTAKSGATIFD